MRIGWRRIGIAMGAIVLILAVSVTMVFHSDWLRDRVRRLAMREADRYLTGTLTIGHLSGSLLHDVTLQDVRLVGPDGAVLSVGQMTVRYDAMTLLHRHVLFEAVTLERPVLRVVETAGGWNVGHLLKPTAGGSTDFAIGRLALDHGDVLVVPTGAPSRHLEDVSADLAVTRQAGRFAVDLRRGSLHDDTSGYEVEQVRGTLQGPGPTMDVTVSGSRADAHISGRLHAVMGPTGARVSGAVDLDRVNLEPLLGTPAWRSLITAHADIEGTLGASAARTALHYRVTAPSARAFGYEGTRVTATGDWQHDTLAFDASAAAYGGAATMRATWRVTAGGTLGPFDGAGAFRGVSLAALPATLHVPPVVAALAGQYVLHVDPAGVHAAVTLDSSAAAGAAIAKGASAVLDWTGGVATYTASGSIAHLDLQKLAAPLDLSTLAADRYRSDLAGAFAITGREICTPCAVPRSITASAVLQPSTFGTTRLTAGSAALSLVGSRLTITGQGDVAHLDTVALGLPPTWTVDLSGSADGSVTLDDVLAPITADTVALGGSIALGPSTVMGVHVDQLQGDVALADGVLTTRRLVAAAADLHAEAHGHLALGPSASSALTVAADADDLRALGRLLQQPVTGAGSLTLQLTGSGSQPEVSGQVSLRDVAYGDSAKAMTVNGTLTGRMPHWDATGLDVTFDAHTTFVSLKTVDIPTLDGTVRYHDDRLDVEAALSDASRTVQVAGDVALGSTGQLFELHTLQLTTKGQTWSLAGGQTATVHLTPTLAEVHDLTLTKGPSVVTLSGAWPLAAGATGSTDQLVLKVAQVQLADVEALTGRATHATGAINATVALSGTPVDPRLAGHLSLTGGQVGTTPFGALTADVSLAEHDLTLDATLVQSGANQLKASGHLPVGAGAVTSVRPMAVAITSTPIDLSLAQLFTSVVSKVSGTGEVNLRLTGSPQAPVVDGTIRIDGGAFTLVGSGVSYRSAAAALTFTANRLTVDTLTVTDDDGHLLRAEGSVDVPGDPAKRGFNLHVSTSGIHVLNNDLGTLQLGADLQLAGDFAAPKVSGRVSVESGRLQVDRILQTTTRTTYSLTPEGEASGGAAPEAASTRSPELTDRLAVDVQLNLPDNLVMRGRNLRVNDSSVGLGDMNVIAGGRMHIVKPAGGQLDIVGSLDIVRGTYTFQGRRFDITRGSDVQFRGNDVGDPTLNLSADQDVNGIDATVHVGGTAQKPQLTLSSQPPLDEAEILSLIVFGQSVGDLGQTDRTALADSAAAMAAGTLTTPLADSVAQALDLDTFEVLAPTETEQLPVVSLGSTIGSRIYVGLKREVGGSSSAVSFEYRFTRFLRLVTSFAQGALETHVLERTEAAGIDLLFVFRF